MPRSQSRLRLAAAVSFVYDALAGVMMTAGRPIFLAIFTAPLPVPAIYADLNGVFLLAVAAGYTIPYRDPGSSGGRAYLWVMGPMLKSAGALAFVVGYFAGRSPASFLLFAVTDAAIAALTLWALLTPTTSPAADA